MTDYLCEYCGCFMSDHKQRYKCMGTMRCELYSGDWWTHLIKEQDDKGKIAP